MAYPASKQQLSDALKSVSGVALQIKSLVGQVRNASVSSAVNRQEFLALQVHLNNAIIRWNSAAAMPGLGALAKSQYDDTTLDIGVEFTAMLSAAMALRDWIFNNFPRDSGSSAVLVQTVDITGATTQLTFSSAALTQFRVLADTLIKSIG